MFRGKRVTNINPLRKEIGSLKSLQSNIDILYIIVHGYRSECNNYYGNFVLEIVVRLKSSEVLVLSK